ncbi:MAG: hypothetical protein GX274_07390 [Clostridiales bacterium]|nr:hypothetical protein [Bacillota bacterium]NLK91373.1 hypothetical protein [Clostridiales bacterium]
MIVQQFQVYNSDLVTCHRTRTIIGPINADIYAQVVTVLLGKGESRNAYGI